MMMITKRVRLDEPMDSMNSRGLIELNLGDDAEHQTLRRQTIRLLRQVPSFVKALRDFAPSDAFRVIVNKDKAHLFKEAADGFYKPYLHNGKKFVGNVDLAKISPDHIALVSGLLSNLNMAVMAAELSAIKVEVRDLNDLISNISRGGGIGEIGAIKSARKLKNSAEKRREMLGACRDLSVKLRTLIGQMKAHVSAMPKVKNGLLEGFFNSGLDDATAKYLQVEEDLAVLKDGMAALLDAYAELDEPDAARESLLASSRA
jgi:hypothetical protein